MAGVTIVFDIKQTLNGILGPGSDKSFVDSKTAAGILKTYIAENAMSLGTCCANLESSLTRENLDLLNGAARTIKTLDEKDRRPSSVPIIRHLLEDMNGEGMKEFGRDCNDRFVEGLLTYFLNFRLDLGTMVDIHNKSTTTRISRMRLIELLQQMRFTGVALDVFWTTVLDQN